RSQDVAWKTRLGGFGISSPIVWGDQVFVTSQIGRGESRVGPRLGQGQEANAAERSLSSGKPAGDNTVRFIVEAFSRTDGRRLWTHTTASEGELPSVHDKHNLASASPVTHGEPVYAGL